MRLYVRGRSKKVTAAEARYAIKFACRELLSPRLNRKITIHLDWRRYPGEKGHIVYRERNLCPRSFDVACDPGLSRVTTLKTLFHECVHAEQMARGRLMDYLVDTRYSRWKTRRVNEESVPYEMLPWEVEASRLEKVLYERYKRHLREEGTKW